MRTIWYRIDQPLPRTPSVFGLMDPSRTEMIYIGQTDHLDDAIAGLMADSSHKVHQHDPKLICVEAIAIPDVRQRRYGVLTSEYKPPANDD